MANKSAKPFDQIHIAEVDPKTRKLVKKAFAAPTYMPSDLVPGELISYGGNNGWYFFADKQRFWTGTSWQLTGTIMPVTADQLADEKKLYKARRAHLKTFGWIP